jgi:hypothetical protein
MTASLRELANPENVIRRNVRFMYPVRVDEADAIPAEEYVIDEILGERYSGNSNSPSQFLLKFKGFDKPEWTSARNVSAPDLLDNWNSLSKEVRKQRTLDSQALLDRLDQIPAPKLKYEKSKVSPTVKSLAPPTDSIPIIPPPTNTAVSTRKSNRPIIKNRKYQ